MTYGPPESVCLKTSLCHWFGRGGGRYAQRPTATCSSHFPVPSGHTCLAGLHRNIIFARLCQFETVKLKLEREREREQRRTLQPGSSIQQLFIAWTDRAGAAIATGTTQQSTSIDRAALPYLARLTTFLAQEISHLVHFTGAPDLRLHPESQGTPNRHTFSSFWVGWPPAPLDTSMEAVGDHRCLLYRVHQSDSSTEA